LHRKIVLTYAAFKHGKP